MKHKFEGQTCIYCGKAPSESKDHIVGRNFFLVERRGDLPQVPACKRCNNRKSGFENYLMIVLAFGAKHQDALANLQKLVAHRLENKANAKLLRKLERGFARSGGKTIPFEHAPLDGLFAMVAQVLAWQHFGVRLEDGYSAIAGTFRDDGQAFVDQLISRGNIVTDDLGEGTFSYEGAQSKEDPHHTVWKFRIYGGVDFGVADVLEPFSLTVAVTDRSTKIQNLRYTSFSHDRNAPKVGRNDPCPCGSGKKHKKCCGSVAKTEARERAHALVAARGVVPSTYQPHGDPRIRPTQFVEMVRPAQ